MNFTEQIALIELLIFLDKEDNSTLFNVLIQVTAGSLMANSFEWCRSRTSWMDLGCDVKIGPGRYRSTRMGHSGPRASPRPILVTPRITPAHSGHPRIAPAHFGNPRWS